MDYGFIKVAAAIPSVKVADCAYNARKIKDLIVEADKQGAEVTVFPELCITGYTCGDLFLQEELLYNTRRALQEITDFTTGLKCIVIVGFPFRQGSMLFNAAGVIYDGKLLGIVPKKYLPNYNESYEQRWFTSGHPFEKSIPKVKNPLKYTLDEVPFGSNLLFCTNGMNFAIEICEDVWSPIPPSSHHALNGADIIFNLSADNAGIGKHSRLKSLLSQQSARCLCGYVFASCGYGESTTDLVYGGSGFIYENGQQLAEAEKYSIKPQLIVSEIDVEKIRHERTVNKTFSTCIGYTALTTLQEVEIDNYPTSPAGILTRKIDPSPFVPQGTLLNEHCEEAFNIQLMGLCKRIEHTRCQTVVIGISGGLDSTLALLVCAKAFDKLQRPRREIIGVTMPGFGTTGRTYNNALNLMKSLDVTIREISIKEACIQHFRDIGHDADNHDVTYENSQARERTQILMDVANQESGLVIGTGDLSELALGWATYNGDHMSMYGVNAGIPKTFIRHLVAWIADTQMDDNSKETLYDIIDTPISPELIPADEQGNIRQKTEDLVGPYELHDFFLYHFIRNGFRSKKIYYLAQQAFNGKYSDEVIKYWLTTFVRRFFNQQFKRSCLPDGPKVGSVSLSPRGNWRMPSDASVEEWLRK